MTAADIIAAAMRIIAAAIRNDLHAPVPMPDSIIAAHVLAALKARGYEVVQLPTPDSGPDGEGQYSWRTSIAESVTATPDDEGHWRIWDVDCDMEPHEAREHAAALLAAANAAEEAK